MPYAVSRQYARAKGSLTFNVFIRKGLSYRHLCVLLLINVSSLNTQVEWLEILSGQS